MGLLLFGILGCMMVVDVAYVHMQTAHRPYKTT